MGSMEIVEPILHTYALAKREHFKADYPESCREIIDAGIVPSSKSDNYCKGVLEIYKYMKDDLGYTDQQIDSIIEYPQGYYSVNIDKVIKIVKDEKSDYNKKSATLSKAFCQVKLKGKIKESTEETIDFIKVLSNNTLIGITFPIWIIPTLILYWMFKDYHIQTDNGIFR